MQNAFLNSFLFIVFEIILFLFQMKQIRVKRVLEDLPAACHRVPAVRTLTAVVPVYLAVQAIPATVKQVSFIYHHTTTVVVAIIDKKIYNV